MPRSTRSRDRYAETFTPVDRRPLLFAAGSAVLILAAAISCSVKERETAQDTTALTTQPTVVTDSGTSGEIVTERVVNENVSFTDAESAYTQKRYGEATEMFTAYVQRRPGNPWGHYMLGLSAWKSGELETARGAFERSLELDPKHVKSQLNLARVLLEQDRASDALEHVRASLAIDSGSAETHRMMGRVLTALRMPDKAVESYRVALTLDSLDVWSMNNMGLVLIREERFVEALPPLARAVQLRPGSPVFQNNLGMALEHTGHFVAATEAYRAAVAADSTYRKASLSLTRVETLTDDPTVGPVDLVALAASFAEELRPTVESSTVPVQTTVVAPDSIAPRR